MRPTVQIPTEEGQQQNKCEGHSFDSCENIFTRRDDSVKVFRCPLGGDYVAVKCTEEPRSEFGEECARRAIPPEILTRYTCILTGDEMKNVVEFKGNEDEHISYSRAFENSVTIKDLAFVQEVDEITKKNTALVQACVNETDKLRVFEELKDTVYTVFAYLYSKELLHYDIKVDNVIAHTSGSNIRFAVLDFDLCSPIREKSDDSTIVRGHAGTKSVRKDSGPILTVHDLTGDTNMLVSEDNYVAIEDPNDNKVTYYKNDVNSEVQSIGLLLQTAANQWLGLKPGTYSLGSKRFFRSTPQNARDNIGYTFRVPDSVQGILLKFEKIKGQRSTVPQNVVTFGAGRATANLAASAIGLVVCGITALAGALRRATGGEG